MPTTPPTTGPTTFVELPEDELDVAVADGNMDSATSEGELRWCPYVRRKRCWLDWNLHGAIFNSTTSGANNIA